MIAARASLTPAAVTPATAPDRTSGSGPRSPSAPTGVRPGEGSRVKATSEDASGERASGAFDRLLAEPAPADDQATATTPSPVSAPPVADDPESGTAIGTDATVLPAQVLGLLGWHAPTIGSATADTPPAVPAAGRDGAPAALQPAMGSLGSPPLVPAAADGGPLPATGPMPAASPDASAAAATTPATGAGPALAAAPTPTRSPASTGDDTAAAFAALLPAATGPGRPRTGQTADVSTADSGMTLDAPLLATGMTAPASAAARAAAAMPALAQPADPQAGFGDELGARVAWLADQRIGHAQIRIAPDHLGPVDVRLQLDGSHVRAEFFSAQAEVRHALEASLPRLRDMLGQHGLDLAQADVGHRQPDARPQRHAAGTTPGQDEHPAQVASAGPAPQRPSRGLVDAYA